LVQAETGLLPFALSEIPTFAATNATLAAQSRENSLIRRGLSAETGENPEKNLRILPK